MLSFNPVILLFLYFFQTSICYPTKALERRADVSGYQASVPRDNGTHVIHFYLTVMSNDGTGAGQSLPAPTAAIKYITIGRGTQNYTCSAPGALPTSIGANATLWDISRLLDLPQPYNLQVINNSPRLAINIQPSQLPAVITAEAIGHHYFNGGGQPTFDLGAHGLFVGKKVANIPAPPNSSTGPAFNPPQDTGAVDWLQLIDAGGSVGLSQLYRVECAGGKPPATCNTAGPLFQQYSCLYWFYG